MKWTFEQGRPIYMQIVEQMRINIASKMYEPGEQLPPVREMAMEASVNPNTMQRAFAELERDGLIYTMRTSGRFVTKEEKTLDSLKKSLGGELVNEFFDKMEKLGMTRKEILEAVNQRSVAKQEKDNGESEATTQKLEEVTK